MTINRETFEAWLFNQPLNRTFNYFEQDKTDDVGCLVCNFLRETTNIDFRVGGIYFRDLTTNEIIQFENWLYNLTHTKPLRVKEVQEAYTKTFGPIEFPDLTPGVNVSAGNTAQPVQSSAANIEASDKHI